MDRPVALASAFDGGDSENLRGRMRRRVRRQVRQSLNESSQQVPITVRGRSRRRLKRCLRSANGNGDSMAPNHWRTSSQAPSRRGQLSTGRLLSSSTGPTYLISEPNNQGTTTDDAMPAWLLEAGIRQPMKMRRISGYLSGRGKWCKLVLDQPTVKAVESVGQDNSNELLNLLLSHRENVILTMAGLLRIMRWISLSLWKQLTQVASTMLSIPDLLLSAVPNKSNGLELLEYFLQETEFQMNDQVFNSLLEKYLDSILPPRTRSRSMRFADEKNFYWQLSGRLLAHFPERKIFATTVRRAVRAISRSPSEAKEVALHLFLDRCSETLDFENLCSQAANWAGSTAAEMLRDRLLETTLAVPSMIKMSQGEDLNQTENLLVTSGKQTPGEENLFVNQVVHNGCALALRWLRGKNPALKVTQVMTRAAISSFNPEDLQEQLQEKDIIFNEVNLMAAMDINMYSQQGQRPKVAEFLLSKTPQYAVSAQVLVAAAQAMPYSVFRKILNHNRSAILSPLAVIAAMRSTHPALEKVRLILKRIAPDGISMDNNFCVSLIASNHPEVARVFKFLMTKVDIRTTDSMIVAAWRTDDAVKLMGVLFRDRYFTMSTRTISAILRERPTLHKTTSTFRYLLQRAKNVVLDGDLIADSFHNYRYYRILLNMHGTPTSLLVSEAKLVGLLEDIQDSRFRDPSEMKQSLIHYESVGGRLSLSRRVFESLARLFSEDFELVLQLWQKQTAVDLLSLITIGINTARSTKACEQILEFVVRNGPERFDSAIVNSFEPHEFNQIGEPYGYRNFYDMVLQFIYRGDFKGFEKNISRLADPKVPPSDVEKFFAQVVNNPPEERDPMYTDIREIIGYLAERFRDVVLGTTFFRSLNTSPRAYSEETIVQSWATLLSSPIIIDWSSESQALMFWGQSVTIVTRAMMAIGEAFSPCEEIALAAIDGDDAVLKLELLWQQKPDLHISDSMVESAVRSTSVDALDFLMRRSAGLQVTEGLVRIALDGVPPGERVFPNGNLFTQREEMVRYLMAHETSLDLSQSTLRLAIRNLKPETARELIQRRTNACLEKRTVLEILDSQWLAEDISHEINSDPDGVKLLGDHEILDEASQTEEGRSFLRLSKSGDAHIDHLINERLFAEVPLKSRSYTWFILDRLHRTGEMSLDDEAIANLWTESTRHFFSTKQVFYHVLDQGFKGRMGAETFKHFPNSCFNYYWDRPPGKSDQVCDRLPALTLDITGDLMGVVRDDPRMRVAFDCILGPDYDTVIHESALVRCAHMGEELWLVRLLELAKTQALAITDKGALLDAAKSGGNRSVIEICRRIREHEPGSILSPWRTSGRRVMKEALSREHYIARQRLRCGRPRVTRPLRRAFDRFLCDLKLRCNQPQRAASDTEVKSFSRQTSLRVDKPP